MDNSMEKGLDWANLWSLRMSGEQCDTYGMTMAHERESYCEAKRSKYDLQLAIQTYGTTLWCDMFERTK